jgi:hypothetical protein
VYLRQASVLAAVAQETECMLVIDQLAAVSLASDRNPELFEVLKDIIRQADAYPRMRLLLARRRVDSITTIGCGPSCARGRCDGYRPRAAARSGPGRRSRAWDRMGRRYKPKYTAS